MTDITPYPLCWPQGFPRAPRRERGTFRTALPGALKNVRETLRLFGQDSGRAVSDIVISSNVTLGSERPADPAVAVWFTWEGMRLCIAVDRYQTVEANLQAVHLIMEARRTEVRHGGLNIIKAAFAGFRALPAPISPGWRAVLGLADAATLSEAERAFKEKAKSAHPDAGGSTEAMSNLTAAITEARKALSHG